MNEKQETKLANFGLYCRRAVKTLVLLIAVQFVFNIIFAMVFDNLFRGWGFNYNIAVLVYSLLVEAFLVYSLADILMMRNEKAELYIATLENMEKFCLKNEIKNALGQYAMPASVAFAFFLLPCLALYLYTGGVYRFFEAVPIERYYLPEAFWFHMLPGAVLGYVVNIVYFMLLYAGIVIYHHFKWFKEHKIVAARDKQ